MLYFAILNKNTFVKFTKYNCGQNTIHDHVYVHVYDHMLRCLEDTLNYQLIKLGKYFTKKLAKQNYLLLIPSVSNKWALLRVSKP